MYKPFIQVGKLSVIIELLLIISVIRHCSFAGTRPHYLLSLSQNLWFRRITLINNTKFVNPIDLDCPSYHYISQFHRHGAYLIELRATPAGFWPSFGVPVKM